MTLDELERWLALEITRYHADRHGALGIPPLSAWCEAVARRVRPVRQPQDLAGFMIDFLPSVDRLVRRDGIHLFGLYTEIYLTMIKSLFSLCFSFFLSAAAFAQHEGDNWLMGWGAGLRFLPDGSFSFFSGQQHTREGVASISDPETGDLLFYTDGTTVWNRQHSVMLNGKDLLGNYSAAQSAVNR